MKQNRLVAFLTVAFLLAVCREYAVSQVSERNRPNVILIITDDQGYGDIAAHGNPVIQTPHLDKLHSVSVRLTDFHVDPTCSPSRSALLTGRYSTRAGVWHTINGRSMLPPEELTLAEILSANGYRTGMVGKWHLGANYPCRPEDQGFDHAVRHQSGGVGQGSDYWGNDYFDDTYKVNGEWQPFDGYCTDVWFREAVRFVEKNKERPFFLYLATNAPHGPFLVDERYSKPYEQAGLPEELAKFCGMITNIDENVGRFRERLAALGLEENTLLIFMTDNGSAIGGIKSESGYEHYNAGMRGRKGSQWDGGHRVPCYFYWPKGGLKGGRDVDTLSAHIDMVPTLVDLLGLKKSDGPRIDGVSLKSALLGVEKPLPERTLFAHVQRTFLPPKWTRSAAMTERWRLIDGKELYDIVADPGQKEDVAVRHPKVVERLRRDYETWWTSLETALQRTVHSGLGGAENPTTLYSHDWLMPGREPSAWHQNHIKRGALINGAWPVDVEKTGNYEIALYRWAPYLKKAMDLQEARLTISNIDEKMSVPSDATRALFRVKLEKGRTMLKTWLIRGDGKEHGAYYVTVRYVPGER